MAIYLTDWKVRVDSSRQKQQAMASHDRATFRFQQLSRHLGSAADGQEVVACPFQQFAMDRMSARGQKSVWQNVEQAPEGAEPFSRHSGVHSLKRKSCTTL